MQRTTAPQNTPRATSRRTCMLKSVAVFIIALFLQVRMVTQRSELHWQGGRSRGARQGEQRRRSERRQRGQGCLQRGPVPQPRATGQRPRSSGTSRGAGGRCSSGRAAARPAPQRAPATAALILLCIWDRIRRHRRPSLQAPQAPPRVAREVRVRPGHALPDLLLPTAPASSHRGGRGRSIDVRKEVRERSAPVLPAGWSANNCQ